MGMFSSLASVAAPITNWSMGGSIGGNSVQNLGLSMIPGVGAYLGQQETNQANAQQARDQMNFQERMSNTQYQRGTADMKAAGLNPMLAYAQGGASAPNGAQAVMQNAAAELGKTVSSAMEALSLKKDLEQKDASIALTNEQNKNTQVARLGLESEAVQKHAEAMDISNTVSARQQTSSYYKNLAKSINAQNTASAKAAKVQEIQSQYDEKAAPADAVLKRVGTVLGAVKSAKDVVAPTTHINLK